ncbi:ATP-dependent zinc metalloprotease FtsH [Candidatus Dependentiae bacterium]|nr:ATP-dependent zinc metalloprotease FtsH [Candidatus Dependentiae bacterium]
MKKIKFNQFKGGPGNFFLVALFVGLALMAVLKLADFSHKIESISYSMFLKRLESNQVKAVIVTGNDVKGIYRDGKTRFEVTVPQIPKIWDLLKEHNVETNVVSSGSGDFGIWQFIYLIPFFMLLGAAWYFFRQSRSNGGNSGNIFTMSKSKAKMFMPSQIKVNFNSVAGATEAKEELADIVDFLKNPEKYKRLGARLPRGVLLVGEPGNGKTLLAKAVAGEANCPFFSVSGSDFIEVFVGVGAARVRDLFVQARRHSPSIVFIDEIDAVGKQRGNGLGGGNDEREQTLNQLLTEMDGFETADASVIVIGATNRPDVLDKALLRPGRFDRRVDVPYPDVTSREEILKVHAQGVKIDTAVDLKRVARGTPGFTGADLANLINEAAIIASKTNEAHVSVHDFEEARDKVLIGKELKTIILTEREKRITAFHEAGHALVTLLLPGVTDPLHKVTIVPRGRALGITFSLPEREKHSVSRDEMIAKIMICLGGRAAEELVFNELATGAYSDFSTATDIVRRMVCKYGMSKKLGPLVYNEQGENTFSEETARMIDDEMRAIMDECNEQVIGLLSLHRDKLDTLANALFEKETLHAGEIYTLLDIQSREEHLFK